MPWAYVLRSLGRLLDVPGVFVWGSNDYYAPTLKNPLRYLTEQRRTAQPGKNKLPWGDLGRGVRGARLGRPDQRARHARDPRRPDRLPRDRRRAPRIKITTRRWPARSTVRRSIWPLGVTHAPYRRVLDAMTYDGHDLILAGHTHGGQVCVPGIGALVTNCDLDPDRVKGLSRHTAGGQTAWLHVSAGLGTSPFAPIRFACPPEATLLTLTGRARCRVDAGRTASGSRADGLDSPRLRAARGVAQLGSALRSGRRGRRFKSCHPDQCLP